MPYLLPAAALPPRLPRSGAEASHYSSLPWFPCWLFGLFGCPSRVSPLCIYSSIPHHFPPPSSAAHSLIASPTRFRRSLSHTSHHVSSSRPCAHYPPFIHLHPFPTFPSRYFLPLLPSPLPPRHDPFCASHLHASPFTWITPRRVLTHEHKHSLFLRPSTTRRCNSNALFSAGVRRTHAYGTWSGDSTTLL
ncbi:hypothetical protein BV20DRAFT_447251 [Pilatotrama ljubarskyi]|nr:hypothetical protein BV20DRAFT_447251 [Pilatotrama ljubarskyi]